MKKVIFTTHFLCAIAALFSTFPLYSMQKIWHSSILSEDCMEKIWPRTILYEDLLTAKKQINEISEQAKAYNQENSLIKLSATRTLFNGLLEYCHAQDTDNVNKLYFSIKNFLALSGTCKHLNTTLILKNIGALCKNYNFDDKNELLRRLLVSSTKNKRHLMTTILMYAGADADTTITVCNPLKVTYSPLTSAIQQKNTPLIALLLNHKADPNQLILREPALFCAHTRTIAQMLIDKGANIYVTSFKGENILWHIVSNDMPAKLIKFYSQKGVDAHNIRERDHACIFHHLANKAHTYLHDPDNFLKQCRRLLIAYSDMINILNTDNQTPLDIVHGEQKNNVTPPIVKKLIKLFKKYNGKTAYEILQETWPVCFICYEHKEKTIDLPCTNNHNSNNLCLNCYNTLLGGNSRCPLCRSELKKIVLENWNITY